MCRSQAEGGTRCAAHTRPKYEAAVFGTAEWDEAAAEYARTKKGREVVTKVALDALRTRDFDRACAAQSALDLAERRNSADAEVATRRDTRVHNLLYTNSQAALRRAAGDEDPAIRVAVARNASAPQDVVDTLAQDRRKGVRAYVASRSDLSPAAVNTLLDDRDFEIRARVLSSGSAKPEGALDREWERTEDYWQGARLVNIASGQGNMEVLRRAVEANVERLTVARTPNLPRDLALTLMDSEDRFTAGAALLQESITVEEAQAALARRPGMVRDAHPQEEYRLIRKIGDSAAIDSRLPLRA